MANEGLCHSGWRIPRVLKNQVKLRAAVLGISMERFLLSALTRELKRTAKRPVPKGGEEAK